MSGDLIPQVRSGSWAQQILGLAAAVFGSHLPPRLSMDVETDAEGKQWNVATVFISERQGARVELRHMRDHRTVRIPYLEGGAMTSATGAVNHGVNRGDVVAMHRLKEQLEAELAKKFDEEQPQRAG